MGSMSPYNLIPAATAAAGQNNNTGGKGALSSPWNGSGMDLNNAQRILDPLGIGGGGGMNKSAAESFFDPLGIDSGSSGLNLFGNRGNVNGQNSGVPSVLPNLGSASMIPQAPQGGFMPLGQTNPMGGQTPGIFNQMAAQSAGQLFNPSSQFTPPMSGGGKGALGGIATQFGPALHGPVGQFGTPMSGGNIPSQSFGGNVARSGDFGSRFKFQGNIPTKAY